MVCWGQCQWSAMLLMCCGARTGETCGCYGSGWSVRAGGNPKRKGSPKNAERPALIILDRKFVELILLVIGVLRDRLILW